ncbi:MAG: hypothetical protein OEW75_11870 [Cyclobacteriaceae bacterium]|nr:hypothetical protein [Cyclobacteriaceae bacterium]
MKNSAFLLIIFILSACGETTFDKTTINNLYSLDIPSFLSKSEDLNDDASLQYQNVFKEFYIIVIEETQEEFHNLVVENEMEDIYSADFEGYTQAVVDILREDIDIYDETTVLDTIINGLSSKKIEISGKSEDVEVYYNYTLVQGKDNYYQILTWTLLGNKEDYVKDMNRMTNSFREL